MTTITDEALEQVRQVMAENERLRKALEDFVAAYEKQDADNFTDDLRMAYAQADAALQEPQE